LVLSPPMQYERITTENQCAYCNIFIVGYKAARLSDNSLLFCLIVAVCYNQVLV